MNPELILATERALKIWAKSLDYPKHLDAELVEIWTLMFERNGATPGEVGALCQLVVDECSAFPTPSVGREKLGQVRERATRLQLGRLVKARIDDCYNCLTTPEQVMDGQWVEGGGNGAELDEVGCTRKALAHRRATLREVLALPAPDSANVGEVDAKRQEQIRRLGR